MSRPDRPNIVVIVSDTLRTAFLGCYGNEDIHTPNIDRFAARSALFTQAYPESLPTIPVRRALHTGRRAYPFNDYRPIPWDIVYLPGWQPMADDESTLAEDLAGAGYHTGFVTDTLPYFAPGMNFTRGFWQWEYVRGQQQDRWRSVHAADPDRLARILGVDNDRLYSLPRYHVANTDGLQATEDTCTARTFKWAMQFVSDNAAVPFYLMVDCFDPHEPWEAPEELYRRYARGPAPERTCVHCPYDRDLGGLDEAQVEDIIAHYSGLVTLVDHWFGQLVDRMERLGLMDDTLVIFTSDHGTNHGDNLWRVVGKPGWALLPGTMHLPLIVRDPSGTAAGERIDGLRYNIDVTASVYDAAGVEPSQPVDGASLLPALAGDRSGDRPYLTSRYGNSVWYRDERWWMFGSLDGNLMHVFDVGSDPDLQHDMLDRLDGEIGEARKQGFERILEDAGGELIDYSKSRQTDAIGQKAVRRR